MKKRIAAFLICVSPALFGASHANTPAQPQRSPSSPPLSTSAGPDDLLIAINRKGIDLGLAFETFIPGVRTVGTQYDEMPVAIKVKGSRKNTQEFVREIGQLPNLATIDYVVRDDKNGEAVDMTAIVKIYWERK